MSREPGYYRVQDLAFRARKEQTLGWGIVYFGKNNMWLSHGMWMAEERFIELFYVPEQTPVNPMPADEGYEYFSVEEWDEDMNQGHGGWQVFSDELQSQAEAETFAKENAEGEHRVCATSVSKRVIGRVE